VKVRDLLIAGAGGHAVEILSVLQEINTEAEVYFFDDYNLKVDFLFGQYKILHSTEEVATYFIQDSAFVLGTGSPKSRDILYHKLTSLGGRVKSVIAASAIIGTYEVFLGEGINIMPFAAITQRVSIGKGSLVHMHASVHHDSEVGIFCELSPGCRILGGVKIGNYVSVGSNAVILPQVNIGNYAVIGAGAVVTKDVAEGQTVVGVPAKEVKKK